MHRNDRLKFKIAAIFSQDVSMEGCWPKVLDLSKFPNNMISGLTLSQINQINEGQECATSSTVHQEIVSDECLLENHDDVFLDTIFPDVQTALKSTGRDYST